MNQIERMCQKDRSATLAALMLAALTENFEDLVETLADVAPEVEDAQNDLFSLLIEHGHMTPEQSLISYVEPACIEHGVVHINVCQPDFKSPSFWLEVSPVTGSIARI